MAGVKLESEDAYILPLIKHTNTTQENLEIARNVILFP